MRKSLQLQADMTQEFGTCVFDVTLDCEDGAPVGGEAEHAALVTELALATQAARADARIAVRVHPVDHPSFEADISHIAGRAGHVLTHIMVPKVESVADVNRAEAALVAAGAAHLPMHVLIESPAAVHRAFEIAAHSRVQSISFGLMDFVSAHGGAIPAGTLADWNETLPLLYEAETPGASAGIGLHFFAGAVLLLFGPIQLISQVRARAPAVHRWIGRIYALAGNIRQFDTGDRVRVTGEVTDRGGRAVLRVRSPALCCWRPAYRRGGD